VKAVIVQFIQNPEPYQDAAGHAGRQTENVQKCITFMPDNIPKSDFEVMDPHGQTSKKGFNLHFPF
jgi:hypothetical protein